MFDFSAKALLASAKAAAEHSIHYRAETAEGVYTITREIAGGAFTPRFNGVALRPAGKLRDSRAQCVRHNGGQLEWTDEVKARYA